MTSAPATPWPGERPLAERYAALRHPALAPVELLRHPATDTVDVRPSPLPADAAIPTELPVRTALRAAGEVALGLQALHELGLCHGAVRPDSIRSVGSRWVLTGIARPGDATDQQADVAALGRLVRELTVATSVVDPDVAAIADTAATPHATAGEVGRTALALAGGARPAGPTPRPPEPAAPASGRQAAHLLETRRRRTRNRMLLVTAIVVIVGAALLKLLDTRGIVTVPNEIGRTQPAAVASLRHAGLVPAVTHTSDPGARPGTVISQTPAAGERVRPGRTVTLRVAAAPAGTPAR